MCLCRYRFFDEQDGVVEGELMIDLWGIAFDDELRDELAQGVTTRVAAAGFKNHFSKPYVVKRMNAKLRTHGGSERPKLDGTDLYNLFHQTIRFRLSPSVRALISDMEGEGSCFFGCLFNLVRGKSI